MSLVLLAPMEGLIDEIMRDLLTRSVFYDWSVTEFARVSGTTLPARCFRRIAPELLCQSRTVSGTPVRVQLLGSDPESMAGNAVRLASLSPAGIDLNFGCPAPLVNLHGGGAVLLDEPECLHRIASACARAIGGRVPFTAKMRLGVSDKPRCIEAAQALADGGVDMLVVHARTRDEAYRPPAHWAWIAKVAEAVKVPVVANGEIWSVEDYQRCRMESACSRVMLGRGAVADPFLVERIRAYQNASEPCPVLTDWLRLTLLLNEFWQRVQTKVHAHHAPGRLKQWLNLLRRRYPQAELLHAKIRPLREIASISAVLAQAGGL